MKNKISLILSSLIICLLITIPIVILTNLPGNDSSKNSTYPPFPSPTNESALTSLSPTFDITVSPSFPVREWETLNYDFADFEPKFSIDYPADWKALIDYESSGGNDVRLSKEDRQIEFDATVVGVPTHNHEDALQAFVTNFGSREFSYKVSLHESGNLMVGNFKDHPNYSIYKLTNSMDNSVSYAIIVDPYHLDGHLGSLFIWEKSGQDLELIKQMLMSVKVIP